MNDRAKSFGNALLVVAMLAVAAAGAAQADYVAYAITDKGEYPLPESVDSIDHKFLINMRWGDYSGPQSRVAVLEVDNTSDAGTFTVTGPGGEVYSAANFDYARQVPVNGIEAMITDVMQRSGRFRMVEREFIGAVLDEQNLGDSSRVSQPSAAKIGKVLGAQYLIQAVVTSYEPEFKKKKGGLGGITKGLLGGAKVGKSKSMVGMNFRLIDSETSEILFTKQVDVIMTTTQFDIGGAGWGSGGALGGFLSSYSKTPIGQGVMAAVNIGVYELAKQIGNAPVDGSVIKVDGDSVYVNLGDDVLDPGDSLTAVVMGEELIDPDTGLSLGGEEEAIGTLQVVSVQEKFSIAESLRCDLSRLERGDKVVPAKEAAPLQFAAGWEGPGGKK
jgi:curli biogenesis system outer membrane secretion channel CsgG